MVISNIQTKISTISDLSKICSFEVEFQDKSTTTLIHSTARLLLIKRGKGKFMINGVEYLIEKNTMISILPWDITTITDVTEDLEFYKIVYNFQIINDDLRNICNFRKNQINSIEFLSKNPIKILDNESYYNMESSFIEIKDEVGNDSYQEEIIKKEYSDEFLISSIIRILIKFLRFENKCKIKTDISFDQQVKINQILRYIYSHMSEKLTLDRLSSTFFISKSTLTKYIDENTGFTFTELLNRIRFSKAIDLLMFSDKSLIEIAKNVGYTDSSHFTKIFESTEGIKPGEFKKYYNIKQMSLKKSEQKLLVDVVNYEINNFNDADLTIGKVAKTFGISTSEVNRLIYFQFEKNFYEYLDELRISKACELLKTSDLKIIDVAMKVGYNSTRTFQRSFGRLTGISPNKFRSSINYQDSEGNII